MTTQHRVTVGIDLGGTSTRIGLFDSTMTLLESHAMSTRIAAGPQSVVEEMAAAVSMLVERGAARRRVYKPTGAGIGSPGPINLRTGVLGVLANLPGWDRFPLRDSLANALGLPVVLESDANAAAIAEWKHGAGKSTGQLSMIMLTLGTGVGSGIILDGKVWHGMFGMSGEVGHSTVDPHGTICGCGSRGCLEVYASASGVLRLTRAIAPSNDATPALRELAANPDVTALQVSALADAGDSAAKLAFDRLGWYLGIGIANVINTLDLPIVVIGGGVACAWPHFRDSMFRAVHEYSVVYRLVGPTQHDIQEENCTFICPATLGPAAGLIGAALLPHLNPLAHSFDSPIIDSAAVEVPAFAAQEEIAS
jgi:glucokinase